MSLPSPARETALPSAAEGRCAGCGGSSQRHLYWVQDWRFGAPGRFEIVVCRACGLGRLVPTDAAACGCEQLYPADYPAHLPCPSPGGYSLTPARPPGGGQNPWAAAARALGLGYPRPAIGRLRWAAAQAAAAPLRRWALARPFPHFVRGARLLDVGCGRGDFVRGMQARGWEAMGLDPSPRAVAAAQRQGLPVVQGTLATCAWPAGYFHAITFLDSFEHCSHPRATLAAVVRLLAPGGELLIRFPNFGSIWRQAFGRYWADIAAPRHEFFYSPAVLRRLVNEAGLVVTGCYRQPSADISRSLRIWRRARGQPEAGLWRWAQILDRLLAHGHSLLRAQRPAHAARGETNSGGPR